MTLRTAGPGPANYLLPPTVGFKDHALNKHRAPYYSMGIRTPILSQKARGPGEKYDVHGMTRYGRSTSPSFSIKHRPKDLSLAQQSPGPAGYNPTQPLRGPAFSIGRRTPYGKLNDIPGPKYNIPTTIGPKVPDLPANGAFSIAAAKRDLAMKEQSPGPAKYSPPNVDLIRRSGPKYSIGGKIAPLKAMYNSPGPAAYGAYKPPTTAIGFTFGHRTTQTPYVTADDELPCID